MGVYVWELCCHDSMSVVMAISSHHIISHEMFTDLQLIKLSSYVWHVLRICSLVMFMIISLDNVMCQTS